MAKCDYILSKVMLYVRNVCMYMLFLCGYMCLYRCASKQGSWQRVFLRKINLQIRLVRNNKKRKIIKIVKTKTTTTTNETIKANNNKAIKLRIIAKP